MLLISFKVWCVGQAALGSLFMIRAMWKIWKGFSAELGPRSTPSLLALFWALHGAAGVMLFGAMALAAAVADVRHELVAIAMAIIAFCSLPLILIKSALAWLGEERGGTRWWRLYLASSGIWASLALLQNIVTH